MKKANYEADEIVCSHCGKKLMENVGMSMISIVSNNDGKVVAFNPCCKGACDKALKIKGMSNDWKELGELANPYGYLKYFMAVLNNEHEGGVFANEESFDNFKSLMISLYPYVTRDLTESEIESANFMQSMPF